MPTYTIDGTWFEPMYQMLPLVIERMRQGGGPALVEGQVIRMDSHFLLRRPEKVPESGRTQ